jgi:hypothetical protein
LKGFATLKLWKRVAAVIVVFVVILSFAVFSSGNTFLFSRDLQVQKLWPATGYMDQYVSELNDSSGHIGEVAFTLNEVPGASLHRVWVDISHYNNTLLDSVVFKFSNPSAIGNIAVYVEANHPQVKVNTYQDGRIFVIEATPSDIMQRGTLHIDFVVETFGSIDKLQMGADLTLHQQAFLQLTQMKASLTIDHNILQA